MTLDQFKEKLFRKANMFSVTLDYLGTKYQVGYYTPNDNEEIKAIVEYRHGQKEPYCVELDIYRNKNWKIVQINPEANKYTFIVLDATTGQNALNQISAFNEFVNIDGIVLTKLDGTAKGGVVIAIEKEYHLPVTFVGVGEGEDDLEKFDYNEFIDNLF